MCRKCRDVRDPWRIVFQQPLWVSGGKPKVKGVWSLVREDVGDYFRKNRLCLTGSGEPSHVWCGAQRVDWRRRTLELGEIRVKRVGWGIWPSEGSQKHRVGLYLDNFYNLQSSNQWSSCLAVKNFFKSKRSFLSKKDSADLQPGRQVEGEGLADAVTGALEPWSPGPRRPHLRRHPAAPWQPGEPQTTLGIHSSFLHWPRQNWLLLPLCSLNRLTSSPERQSSPRHVWGEHASPPSPCFPGPRAVPPPWEAPSRRLLNWIDAKNTSMKQW